MRSVSSRPNPVSKRQTHTHLIRSMLQVLSVMFSILLSCNQNVNAQSEDEILATVNGHAITTEEVDYQIANQLFLLQQQIYALRKAALDNLMVHKVLGFEATRSGISLAQLKQRMMAGQVTISDDQVEKLYQQNASAFALMSPDEAKEKLRLDLEGQARLRKYREQLSRLRDSSRIEIFLTPPRLILNASLDSAASRGAQNARVLLTEFSDFQCPYCKDAHKVLRRILDDYPGQVRLDFRHLPLDIHPFALLAAQATYCAGQQGKFWRYHDELFALDSFNKESFNTIARNLELRSKEFEQCLDSSETRAVILADSREASRLGINGTPTIFINGRQFRGVISFEELKKQIEQELKTSENASRSKGPQPLSAKEPKK